MADSNTNLNGGLGGSRFFTPQLTPITVPAPAMAPTPGLGASQFAPTSNADPPPVPIATPGLDSSRYAPQKLGSPVSPSGLASSGSTSPGPVSPGSSTSEPASEFSSGINGQQQPVFNTTVEKTADIVVSLQAEACKYKAEIEELKRLSNNYKMGWDGEKTAKKKAEAAKQNVLNDRARVEKNHTIALNSERGRALSAKNASEAAHKEVAKLQADLKSKSMAAKTLEQANTQFSCTNTGLAAELASAKADLAKASDDKAAALKAKADVEFVQIQLTKSAKKLVLKNTELKKLEEKHQAAKQQIETLQIQLQSLESDMGVAQKSTAASSEEKDALKDAKAKLAVELKGVSNDNNSLIQKIAKLESELKTAGDTVKNLEREKQPKKTSCMQAHLESRKTKQSEEIAELQGQLANRLDHAASEKLKVEVANYQAKCTTLDTRLKGANAKLKDAQVEVIGAKQALGSANAKLLESSSLKSELESQIAELKTDVSRLQTSSSQSKAEVDQLKGEIESVKAAHDGDLQKLKGLSDVEAQVEQLTSEVQQSSENLATKAEELEKVSSAKATLVTKINTTETDLRALKIQKLDADVKVQQSSENLAAKIEELKQVSSDKVDLAVKLEVAETALEALEIQKSEANVKVDALKKELEVAKALKMQLPTPPPSPAHETGPPKPVTPVTSVVVTPPVFVTSARDTQTANKPKRFNVCLAFCLFLVTIVSAVSYLQGFSHGSDFGHQDSLGLIPSNGSTWNPLQTLFGNANSFNDTVSADSVTDHPPYKLPSDAFHTVLIEMPTSDLTSHIPSSLLPTCSPSDRPGCFALTDPFHAPDSDEETQQSTFWVFAHAGSRIPVCAFRAVFTDAEVGFVDCLLGDS